MKRKMGKMGRRRPVDAAMNEERPEKLTIRRVWAEQVQTYQQQYPEDGEFLLLTLPGGEARDIRLLVDKGIIELTEIGALAPSHSTRVAAVENDKQAVLNLQQKVPGLLIKELPFQSLVRGESELRFPDGEELRICRARIVNLDLNKALHGKHENSDIVFPVLSWIKKLGQLHAEAPRRDWCLCLTLHGEITWPKSITLAMKDFLKENFRIAPAFGELSRKFLTEKIYTAISEGEGMDFSVLAREEQQKLLMLIVPKKIVELTAAQRWKITVTHNLRYGIPGHAPMVTWIMHFSSHERAARQPNDVYIENLKDILRGTGSVESDGEIHLEH